MPGKNVVLRSAGKTRADLSGLLPDTGHPQGHVSLALEVTGFDVEAAHHVHHAIELTEIRFIQMRNSVVVLFYAIVMDQDTVLTQQPTESHPCMACL